MRSRHVRRPLLLVPAAAALVLASACAVPAATGGPSTDPGYDAAPNGNAAGTAGGTGESPKKGSAGGETTLQLSATESKDVGWFVADRDGYALYRYDKDTAKPPKSACEGDCAKTWTPVPTSSHTMVSGVDPTIVGEVVRADGTKQATLAGWPLYRFTGDKAPSRTNGQGKGGTWWVVTPEGGKAQSATGAATTPTTGAEGY
ncbi:hypothetical protein [Umezawaea tangerina]|uniref:Putative lipoprotein with Yx(FWY)xxD motif n=1 Tax=Umezawaea tangerina TaxID=84725 RepID=A0A2T0SV96_9PSEU|nr:hypothetical protein [Umezawaea tangerina]PRY37328.1 putative lipoprotein with Yx(FWY)xxD motif [Umezawaea tangerina]